MRVAPDSAVLELGVLFGGEAKPDGASANLDAMLDGGAVSESALRALGGRRVSPERFAEIAVEGRKASAAARKAKRMAYQGEVQPVIQEIIASGTANLRGIAGELNARGEMTPRGGRWSAVQVQRVIGRKQVAG